PCHQQREGSDIRLRVAAMHAERMQFHDLTRQILVQTLSKLRASRRIRSNRRTLIEISKHRGMHLGGKQQIFKAPHHVWSDRFGIEGTGEKTDGSILDADGEVIRPEIDKPLKERGWTGNRGRHPAMGVVDIVTKLR